VVGVVAVAAGRLGLNSETFFWWPNRYYLIIVAICVGEKVEVEVEEEEEEEDFYSKKKYIYISIGGATCIPYSPDEGCRFPKHQI
jgi:hypothetical protein